MSIGGRRVAVLIGTALTLSCAGAVFAGQPEYQLLDFATEPEAQPGGGPIVTIMPPSPMPGPEGR